nr:sugar transferase [Nesterenkonia salmonea]
MVAAVLFTSAAPWTNSFQAVSSPLTTGLLMTAWMVLLITCGAYRVRGVQTGPLIRSVVTASVIIASASAVVGILLPWEAARMHLLVTIPFAFLGLIVVRALWFTLVARSTGARMGTRRVVVVGSADKSVHIAAELQMRASNSSYAVVDVVTSATGGAELSNGQQFDMVASARDAVLRTGADLVVVAGADALDPQALRRLTWDLADLDVGLAVASGLGDVARWRLRTESVAGLAMVHVEHARMRGVSAFLKRLFDIVFSCVVLAIISPVLLVISLAIVVDSRGSILFKQRRIGLDHSRFTMLKFRSMCVDAEQKRAELMAQSNGNGVMFKMRSDPRTTRVGRFIRRFSLDELPQFINVLRGDMSVVGPRPPLPGEVAAYDERADRRLMVKPGITGLWQVHGRSDLSWEESLRLDLYYIENWSIASDARIILRTVQAVVTGSGAY